MRSPRRRSGGAPGSPLLRLLGLLAAAALLLPSLGAQETTSSLGGEFLSRDLCSLSEVPGGEPAFFWASTSTFSPVLRVKGQRTRAEASFVASALAGRSAEGALAASLVSGSQVFVTGGPSGALALGLRTLWARIDLGSASLQLGRQVIRFGRGAFWSPADLFARVDLSGVTPDRLGTDALRLRLPLAGLWGLDAIAAPARDPATGRYATRLSGVLLGVDAGLLGGWDGGSGRLLAAFDCKFDLGPSWYAEAVLSADPATGDLSPRAAWGLDWSTGDWVFAAEYYWNGGGAAADPAFPAAHQAFAAVSRSLSDFAQLACTGLWAPVDGALRGQLVLALSSSQNSDLALALGLSRGAFATRSGTGWAGDLGGSLKVRF